MTNRRYPESPSCEVDHTFRETMDDDELTLKAIDAHTLVSNLRRADVHLMLQSFEISREGEALRKLNLPRNAGNPHTKRAAYGVFFPFLFVFASLTRPGRL